MSTSPWRSSRILQNAKDFLASKIIRYGRLGGRDSFTEYPVRSIAVLLFNGISFVVAEMFWNLKLNYYKYWFSAHFCDKQLSKPSASAANLFKTLGEIDPHMSEWLSLWKGFLKNRCQVLGESHYLLWATTSEGRFCIWLLSQWVKSKHPALAFVYVPQPVPQPSVQLETQLKPA